MTILILVYFNFSEEMEIELNFHFIELNFLFLAFTLWFLAFLSHSSSNVNEVIRAILNFFFFTQRFYTHKKHKTHISEQKEKRQRFYALKKHLRRRKSIVRLYTFCAFYALYAFCACYAFYAFCAFAWLRLCAFYAFCAFAWLRLCAFYAFCACKIFS